MPRRKTQEQAIADFKKVHGDRYRYDKVTYINSPTKVKIICTLHGDFEQSPKNHLRGQGCPKCGITIPTKPIEKVFEDFRKVHEDKYDYSRVIYSHCETKVKIICPLHGEYEQTPSSHRSGCGCPTCGIISLTEKQVKATEDVIEDFKEVHGETYNYSEVTYINSRTKVKIICPLHGAFEQTPNKHLGGSGCFECGKYKNNSGWTYTRWVDTAEGSDSFESFKLYIVQFSTGLYKIGRTYQRLDARAYHFPLDYKIIDIITSEDGREICEMEKLFHSLCAEYKQLPEISFKGENECFSSIAPILPLLE